MIETRRLKNVVIFVQTILSFVLSRKINYLLFMDDLKLYSQSEKRLDSLVQTVHLFSEDIIMEFVIEKCAILVMEKG